jgi:hypothetical protein
LFDTAWNFLHFAPNSEGFVDKTTAILIALGTLALVFIIFFLVFRNKGKGKIKGPFGMGIEVEGSNESLPGVKVTGMQAGGNIRATDSSGRGVSAEKLKAIGDIDISNSSGGSIPKK